MNKQTQLCENYTYRAHSYTCSACTIKSCSIECVKQHNLKQICSGVSDQTQFIPKNVLYKKSNPTVNSDYNYLVRLESESQRRDKTTVLRSTLNRRDKDNHPIKSKVQEYHSNILLTPSGFTRYKQNRSYVHMELYGDLWN
jgi:hypothetical protein